MSSTFGVHYGVPFSLHAGSMKWCMWLVNKVEMYFQKMGFMDSKRSNLNAQCHTALGLVSIHPRFTRVLSHFTVCVRGQERQGTRLFRRHCLVVVGAAKIEPRALPPKTFSPSIRHCPSSSSSSGKPRISSLSRIHPLTAAAAASSSSSSPTLSRCLFNVASITSEEMEMFAQSGGAAARQGPR